MYFAHPNPSQIINKHFLKEHQHSLLTYYGIFFSYLFYVLELPLLHILIYIHYQSIYAGSILFYFLFDFWTTIFGLPKS